MSGLQFVLTTPTTGSSPPLFGSSVSGRLQGTQLFTVDQDKEGRLRDRSRPGYDVAQTAAGANDGGRAMVVVESGFLVVPIPAANTIVTQIGVGTPFGPFSINATTPTTLQIFVFGVPATASTP